jgi:hypothetical protein
MPDPCMHEPLTQDEVNRLANAWQPHEQTRVVWTARHTDLWVDEGVSGVVGGLCHNSVRGGLTRAVY